MHRTQQTSVDALKKSERLRKSVQARVLYLLRGKWQTCAELEEALTQSHQTMSSAISALRDKGKIIDSGQRRKIDGSKAAIVWRLATEAEASKPVIKNGWRVWAEAKPPEGEPVLIRDHQDIMHAEAYMMQEGELVRILEGKRVAGKWHCAGSLSPLKAPPPLAWRSLPTG